MLFNSATFVVFFVGFYALYLLARRHLRAQNALLLVGSYVFYSAWDPRFSLLLALSTVVDFYVARAIPTSSKPKALLGVSLATNLGILATFKYFDFFVLSFQDLLSVAGIDVNTQTLGLILPVGISFYTFQTLSYTIDVYRGHRAPTTSLVDFGVYVAFFPQLVAGPIERATSLLPQIQRERTITPTDVEAGLYLILAGYLKKVVVADNVAVVANQVFNGHQQLAGIDIVIGIFAFAIQIYGDFSGYSDIARGVARLMGFDLILNFRLPYFATTPSDFWRRWHISLSQWLRDYLYIPLGGNRTSKGRTYFNLMATMTIGGLWHGAAWNFVAWGFYHGALLGIYRAFDIDKKLERAGRAGAVLGILTMFPATLYGWLLFRAESFDQIVSMTTRLGWTSSPQTSHFASHTLLFAIPLLAIQLWHERRRDLMALLSWPAWTRGIVYGVALAILIALAAREPVEFIYFQF